MFGISGVGVVFVGVLGELLIFLARVMEHGGFCGVLFMANGLAFGILERVVLVLLFKVGGVEGIGERVCVSGGRVKGGFLFFCH